MFDPLDRCPGRPLFGPSVGDRLLANAQSVRLDLLRFIGDDDKPAVSCGYRVAGEIDLTDDAATGELLRGLVRALGARREGGVE